VFLPGDHALYSNVSRDVRDILARVTPLIEPLALDEAFLDVTGARALFGDGVTIARRLRGDIHHELGLVCSVGVAPNKFLAKLASVDAKPRPSPDGIIPGPGVFEVRPGEELAYLHPLPVERLWGVGPSTLARLRRMGVATVGDLAALPPAAVIPSLGKAHGRQLLDLAAGLDERAVEPQREVKSISHEETFAHDLHQRADVHRELVRLADAVAARLRDHGTAARTFTLKVRDGGFTTITRATTLAGAVDTAPAIITATTPLLDEVDLTAGVRLLGLAASKFAAPSEQLRFEDLGEGSGRWRDASQAIDDVRERFGETAIGPASSVSGGRIRLVRAGTQQWGPDHESETDANPQEAR
jgi:DNA polymerase IV